MKTSLEQLVDADSEINRCNAQIETLREQHIKPLEQARATAGARANELWLAVLKQYGPGEAQRVLREAKRRVLS